jgi:hypothetical protein
MHSNWRSHWPPVVEWQIAVFSDDVGWNVQQAVHPSVAGEIVRGRGWTPER